MPLSIHFLTIEEVVAIHDLLIEHSGGSFGVLKPSALESAVLAPQATFGGQLLLVSKAEIASAYAYYIVTGHPFVDGNKRTGLLAALTFLWINGFETVALDIRWSELMAKVGDGAVDRERLARFFAAVMGEEGALD